tara:strand:- start:85 stop:537 length:453 start_codon:yes stop_codon:yes gene_type:complete
MSDILTDSQLSMLRDILNTLIPADNNMPGAGSVATSFIETGAKKSATTKRTILDMLATTDAVSGLNHNRSFSDISNSSREPLLAIVEEQNRQIFSDFLNLAYDGYYTNPVVIKLLGHAAKTPQPTGFATQPFNPSIVDQVRTLGPRFREI